MLSLFFFFFCYLFSIVYLLICFFFVFPETSVAVPLQRRSIANAYDCPFKEIAGYQPNLTIDTQSYNTSL